MSRRWLAAGAAAVVAAAVFAALGGWYVLRRDDVEPATVADAVASFRAQKASAAATGHPATSIPTGVYVYETDGFEKTDALGGATHRYPPTSTISVTGDPCGAALRWDVLDGRSTTWQLCLRPEGWTQNVRDERHTFFGIGDRTTYRCHGTAFRPTGDTPGTTFSVACTTGEATERGRGRVVGRESCSVGGSAVECVHVRTRTAFGGETSGTSTFDVWLARTTGLPVAMKMVSRTTSGSLIGDVHYEEEVSLRLTSLTPRR
jgi:hypothetical protein